MARKDKGKIYKRRALCAAEPFWRSRANTRSITVSKAEREAGDAERASQVEIQEMSHSTATIPCDLGHDISSLKKSVSNKHDCSDVLQKQKSSPHYPPDLL